MHMDSQKRTDMYMASANVYEKDSIYEIVSPNRPNDAQMNS